jgi:hypothetical protein
MGQRCREVKREGTTEVVGCQVAATHVGRRAPKKFGRMP